MGVSLKEKLTKRMSGPGYTPQQPGYAPQQPGYAPQQPGYAPQHPGYAPPQPGYAPQQPGYAPQHPGFAPQQPGQLVYAQPQPQDQKKKIFYDGPCEGRNYKRRSRKS